MKKCRYCDTEYDSGYLCPNCGSRMIWTPEDFALEAAQLRNNAEIAERGIRSVSFVWFALPAILLILAAGFLLWNNSSFNDLSLPAPTEEETFDELIQNPFKDESTENYPEDLTSSEISSETEFQEVFVPVQITESPVPTIEPTAEILSSKKYKYSVLSDGTAAIKEYIGTDETIEIPLEIEGIPISSFSPDTYSYREKVKAFSITADNPFFKIEDDILLSADGSEVISYPDLKEDPIYTLPKGITKIHENAFWKVQSLSTLAFDDTITEIGKGAFSGAYGLNNISFPEGLKEIPDEAFLDCSGLYSITLPKSLTMIGESAFENCTALPDIDFPPELKEIGVRTFKGCDSLEYLTIPGNIKTIRESAFENCEKLASVVLEEGVVSISKDAFIKNDQLLYVTIPSTVVQIEQNPFAYDLRLSSFSVLDNPNFKSEKGILYSNDGGTLVAYPCGKGKSNTFEVPDTVHTLGSMSFGGCERLLKLNLPKSVLNIAPDAFKGTSQFLEIKQILNVNNH